MEERGKNNNKINVQTKESKHVPIKGLMLSAQEVRQERNEWGFVVFAYPSGRWA